MKVLIAFVAAFLLAIVYSAEIDIPHNKLGKPFKRLEDQSLSAGGSDIYKLLSKEGDDALPIVDGQTLFFMVTPLAGDVDLYVSAAAHPQVNADGVCSNCIASSTTAHGDYVSITKGAPDYPTGDFTLYIMVRGVPDTISSYTLTAWISDHGTDKKGTVIDLEDGIPQVAVGLPMQTTYFRFKIGDRVEIGNQETKANDFDVIVTPFTGDPDIFMSTDEGPDGTQRPSPSKSYWKAFGLEHEFISVTSTDDHYILDGYYYIGIRAFGFRDHAYFMLSATSKKTYTHMIEAISVENLIVPRNGYVYYKYYMPMDKKYELSMTVTSIGEGDPDLFIYPQLDYDKNQPPSNTKCKWCHQGLGDDTAIITKDEATRGYFYVGIRAWKANTRYGLLALSERNNVNVRDGIPVLVPVSAGTYKYFKFFNYDDQIEGISFSAGAPAGSSLKIYYSKPESKNTHPNEQKHDLKGVSQGNEALLPLYGKQPRAMHYFSVYSSAETSVTVSASTSTSATTLQNHVPLPGIIITKDTYRYFIFDGTVDDAGKLASDVSIHLGVQVGEADIFVSTSHNRPTKDKCDNDNKCWRAETYKADSILIRPDDALLQGKTRFYIGVAGFFYQASFITIMAGMTGTEVQLNDGTAVDGTVDQDKYAFYSFDVTERSRVLFQLTLADERTEANIFVSKNPKPTKVSCEGDNECYVSEKIGDDVIDRDLEKGKWYISVHGVSPREAGRAISFVLKASAKHHVIQPSSRISPYLVESTPVGVIQQIKVSPVFASAKWLSFSTSLISGRTKMYINPGEKAAIPGDAKFVVNGWPNNYFTIERNEETEALFTNSVWSIGIEAVEASDYWFFADYGAYYTLPSVLNLNIPRLNEIKGGVTRHFTIDVDKNESNVYLNIRVIRGSVEVFIGQDYTYPTKKEESIAYYSGDADQLLVLTKNKLVDDIPLKITVVPKDTQNALFELTTSKDNSGKFVGQDQPQTFIVDNNPNFVLWNSRTNPKDLVISIESCTMDEAPHFFISKDPAPSKDKHDFQSRSDGPWRQIIRATTDEIHKWNVAVPLVYRGMMATIFATTRKESLPILPSPKLDARLTGEENQHRQYEVRVPKAKPPSMFASSELTYDLYIASIKVEDRTPEAVNMRTACGVRYAMRKVSSVTPPLTADDIKLTLPGIRPEFTYQVNVIVHNDHGLETPYHGFWIVEGEVYPDYPSYSDFIRVSVGSVFLCTLIFAFALYFLIGAIVQVIRGKTGLDVIPNRKFWQDFPFLVWDGVLLIVTCGRRSTTRTITDEDDDPMGYGAKSAAVENSDDDLGGYGAI